MVTGSGRHAVYLCPSEHCPHLLQLAVGLLPKLSQRYGKVGVFRPIVGDPNADLMLSALRDQTAVYNNQVRHWGVSVQDVQRNSTEAMTAVLSRYFDCAANYDAMLILGGEYNCPLTPIEFFWNTRIAANLDVPMVLVVPSTGGAESITQRTTFALREATRNQAQISGVLTCVGSNQQLSASELSACPVPTFVVEDVAYANDALNDLLGRLKASVVAGSPGLSDLRAKNLLIADMGLANLMPLVQPESTVLFSADRTEIAIGLVIGGMSQRYPLPAAGIAAGPWPLDPDASKLWNKLAANVPLLRTHHSIEQVNSDLSTNPNKPIRLSPTQIEAARQVFDRDVDVTVLLNRPPRPNSQTNRLTPLLFEHRLLEQARKVNRHIVLPEGEEERILRAANRLLAQKICRITLLGQPKIISAKAAELGLNIADAEVIDPATSPLLEQFAVKYAELRAKKGITLEQAREKIADVSYFGTMMVNEGLADGMVSGSVNTTAHTIRPALEVIKTKPGVSIVSSIFLMCLADRVLVFGDCAVNPNPTPSQLADIAINSAETARQFGIEPLVAMLSYSTGASGSGPDVEQTIEATRLVRERAPKLAVDGPLQYDAAVEPSVARAKLPDSPVAGQATVLIFPDLQTGNNTYKAVQRSAGALAIGPILQGLNQPVNDLSRGALVSDIVNTVAITALQVGMN